MAKVRGYTVDGLYLIVGGKPLGALPTYTDADALLDWIRKLRDPKPTPAPTPDTPSLPFTMPGWLWAVAGALFVLLTKKDSK